MGFLRRDPPPQPEQVRCAICGEEHPVATMVTAHQRAEDVGLQVAGRFPTPSDWSLANADEMNAQHPRSFFIPRLDRRRSLRDGELVRLEFRYGPHVDRDEEGHIERMWVEVIEQRSDAHAHGRLRNNPVRLSALAIGDLVAFEPENVISFEYSGDEVGYSQNQWPVVDQAVLRDDRAPDIVIRAAGPYVADEDEWWMVCRSNTAGPTTESVNSLTDRFPGLEEPLRAGGGLWELESGEQERARWRRVDDDEIDRSEEWQSFLAWLEKTAERMRSSEDGDSADTSRA